MEITEYGLRQVQVHPRIGFTFAAAMRAFFRADPDVIMVGEMRDEETARTGIEASLTGHLVLSTLHTNSAPETLTRLLASGWIRSTLPMPCWACWRSAWRGRCARRARWRMRRVRCSTRSCGRRMGRRRLRVAGAVYARLPAVPRDGVRGEQPDGVSGARGAADLLVATPEIKRLIQQRSRVTEVAACAQQEGMTTLLQDGVLKVLAGVTDMAQIKAVASK